MLRPIPLDSDRPESFFRAAARMKRRSRSLPALVALALLGPALPASAQAKRCDLVGRDTVITGVPMKKCLDLGALDGMDVKVPANVTRIDNDGLSLCNTSHSQGGNADIVYVYDNSGSMLSQYAWIHPSRGDTVIYQALNGCSNFDSDNNGNPESGDTSGSVTIPFWNSAGTATAPRVLRRLVSSKDTAGCTSTAGDPFNARGRAFRLGISNQASRAPQSTAGIMSFNASVSNRRTPTRLDNAGNVTAVHNAINAVSEGGTNYTPPLDTSKRWLTTNVTSNPTKAVIFLSDGRPDNTNYLTTVIDANMPPIYGIFLGKDTVNTGRLRQLAQLTGGQFFLIPPSRPDSLVSVVDRILDIVLLEFEPNAATVTNSTVGQSATSTAPTGFVLQANGSWLMRLSDIIGLNRNAANQIRVATQFREKNNGTLQNDTVTFTVSTTDPEATTSTIINTQFSRVCYDASRLRILRSDGTRPPALTEADSLYQLRLRTGSLSLTSTTGQASSRSLGDAETPSLGLLSTNADSSVFRVIPSFRIAGTAASGDGTLQASLFDSVFAAWTHPRDAQDVARDTMLVRAANVAAKAWFAAAEGGAAVTNYRLDQAKVFVVIQDQQADPRRSYTAIVTSALDGIDSETVVLHVVSPGVLGGELTVSKIPKARRDGLLQVSVRGDQLKVEYRDPTYGDVAIGTAGFDQDVQEAALLEFVDENGNPLDSGTVWSPAKGKLYVRYSDDYAYGNIASKTITLSLASRRYGVTLGVDDEKLSAAMAAGSAATRATWNGSIDLADAFPAADSNGRTETRYRGEATVTAFSHENGGAQQAATVSDFLVIAYPDSAAVLTWSLADTANVPAGSEGLVIGVRDQNFTVGNDDSVRVSVTCALTGDSVSGVGARETSSGNYQTGILVKNGSAPDLSDRVLSCLSADQIVVRYTDPVYGTGTVLTVNEVARPTATPPGKRFTIQEFVTLHSATPGAVIYYTLDNSAPIPGTSSVYSDPIQIIGNTVIKAIAVLPGWKDSKVMVETYTKDAFASRLEILDENGNAIPGDTLTGSATRIRFKVTTTQANLPPVTVNATTRVAQDAEDVVLPNTIGLGSAIEYWQNAPLNHDNGRTAGNDTLDSRNTDTLIAVWTNPFNPADVARDTVIIRPAFRVSEVYFTAVPNGPKVTTYADTQTVVYVVVKTGPKDPSLTYQVTISATEHSIDDEVVTLTEVSPGVFTAQVPVARGAKSPDVAGTLQVSTGADQLTAVFVDPVYRETYRGNAGFGQDVEESASLDFVHADSSLVRPDEFWSPDEGKVYLRYSDDYVAGIDAKVHERTAKLSLVNKKANNPIGTDEEDVTLTLVSSTATRGIWEGEVQLRDRASSTPLNDTLETYFYGDLTATITPHTNNGDIAGTAVTDRMAIAYPNRPAEIIIRDTSGGAVDRVTTVVEIIVKDQQHTKTGDNSITVAVSCDATGDRLQSVLLTWDGTQYVAVPPIRKGEALPGQSPSNSDSVLSCRSTDRILVTYADPVYSDIKTGDARWSDQKTAKLHFASARDSSIITSVADGVDNSFLVFVEGLSPRRDVADTIDVVLTTNQGEKLTVKAVETGPMTGLFRAQVSYEFITRDPDPANGKLEANINRDQRNNRVIVTAEATIEGTKLKAELALFSAYNMVVRAWIKDVDGDGRADMAFFLFDKKLARLPSSLEEVTWNEEGEKFRQKAGASMLSFRDSDSTVVVADFTKSPFGANLTDIPSGRRPYALFPADNLFGGQAAALADSVGPVPITAVKYPSNLNSYSITETEKRFFSDTLIVTVSEDLKTRTNWSEMVRFSKGCAPYSESVPLKLAKEPERSAGSDLEWKLIVDNSPAAQIPLVGDCIFLETDGRYTDRVDNRPSPLGIELKGENPKQVIRDFRAFPPVAGMDPSSSGFVLVTNDSKKDGTTDGRWSTQTGNGSYQVVWIPPVGLDDCSNASDLMKCLEKKVPNGYDAKATPMRDIENQSFTHMPVKSLSSIQVIATGRYIARVNIYDNFGVHVRSFVQAFGFWGEEKNPWRATEKGLRSFLVWDLKDKNGQMAAQGVYVWKVNFTFSDKKNEIMYTRTGVLRNN